MRYPRPVRSKEPPRRVRRAIGRPRVITCKKPSSSLWLRASSRLSPAGVTPVLRGASPCLRALLLRFAWFRGARASRSLLEKGDREGAGVPERIERARPPAQLGDSLRAPGEVIAFFPRRLLEFQLQRRIARGERLALVERLRADFAAVIDPHEGGSAPALEVRQIGLRVLPGRGRPARGRDPGHGAQPPVEFGDQPVDGAASAHGHCGRTKTASVNKNGRPRAPVSKCFFSGLCPVRSCA